MARASRPARPLLGLALGGGAARGMAHLGVLEVFHEEKIPIDYLAGTSFGAFCGGVYADSRDANALTKSLRAFMKSEQYRALTVHVFKTPEEEPGFFDGTWRAIKKGIAVGGGLSRPSMIGQDEYSALVSALVPDVSIEELQLPFAATSVDLRAGAEVVFRTGSLRKAVMASAAIPGLFPPQRRNGAIYVDGAWADCVPVEPAQALGAHVVIAVDVTSEGPEEIGDLKRSLEVAWVANTVTRTILKNRQLKLANLVIRPKVESLHWANFEAFEDARELGRRAAQEALPAVRALCGQSAPSVAGKKPWWKRSSS